MPRLEEVLVLNPDTKFVIVDPISAYVGKVDSHKNSDVRGLLAPFAELASRFRVAIVAVSAELANGPVPSSDVIELGGEFGFSKRTLQRACKELGGTPRKQAFDGPWLWRLGGQDANEDASNPPSL